MLIRMTMRKRRRLFYRSHLTETHAHKPATKQKSYLASVGFGVPLTGMACVSKRCFLGRPTRHDSGDLGANDAKEKHRPETR